MGIPAGHCCLSHLQCCNWATAYQEDVLRAPVAGATGLADLVCTVPEVQILGTRKNVVPSPNHEAQPYLWHPPDICPHDGLVEHRPPRYPFSLPLLDEGFDFVAIPFYLQDFRGYKIIPFFTRCLRPGRVESLSSNTSLTLSCLRPKLMYLSGSFRTVLPKTCFGCTVDCLVQLLYELLLPFTTTGNGKLSKVCTALTEQKKTIEMGLVR